MNHALTISVPHLHTERLTLREYRVEDFDYSQIICRMLKAQLI